MKFDYMKALDKAYKELADKKSSDERFKIPELESVVQGRKTILKNIAIIAKTLKRDVQHMMKFFIKETGVPANFDGNNIILNGAFNSYKINQMYNRYIELYVYCKQCGKPDTKLIMQHGIPMMKCEACGAINPVKKL